jgi:hypothetical protein
MKHSKVAKVTKLIDVTKEIFKDTCDMYYHWKGYNFKLKSLGDLVGGRFWWKIILVTMKKRCI